MNITQIDIHFSTKGGERVATITTPKSKKGRQLQQILLDQSSDDITTMPLDFTLNAGKSLEDGEGPGVCYMIDGEMVCW